MTPDQSKQLIAIIERLAQSNQKGPWDYAGIVLGIVTLFVLIWYTVETYKLRQSAQKQIELSNKALVAAQKQTELLTMPMLVFVVVEKDILLVNAGSGIALNIFLETAEIEQGGEIQFHAERKVLGPGDRMKVKAIYIRGNDHISVDSISALRQQLLELDSNATITATCESIIGTQYMFRSQCRVVASEVFILFQRFDTNPCIQ